MKNFSIVVAVTALVAFSLGYLARGTIDRTLITSEDTAKLIVREKDTGGLEKQAQTTVSAESYDANASLNVSPDRDAMLTSTRLRPRELHADNKRKRLADFFRLNGIDPARAELMIQDLVDADHSIVQKQNAMIDRHTAEKAALITQGNVEKITTTPAEKAALKAEEEILYRQVFGEYYEAHEEYLRSYPQRRVIGVFSSSLPEPLEYAAKESMVQIMHEERSRLESDLESEFDGPGGYLESTPDDWDVEKERHLKRLDATRSSNERVMDRAKSYLTESQFEQLRTLLDDELRRYERLIDLVDAEQGQ